MLVVRRIGFLQSLSLFPTIISLGDPLCPAPPAPRNKLNTTPVAALQAFDSNPDGCGYGRASGSEASKSTRAGAGMDVLTCRHKLFALARPGRVWRRGDDEAGWSGWISAFWRGSRERCAGDKRRGTAIRAVGSTSALPRVPEGLDPCSLVLFLARGRGAVAAGGFISCQPHRAFITNCQARSLILGG